MNLIDVLTSPWAILPAKLLEIQAVYATHLRGEKIDLEAVEARIGKPLANEQKKYELQDGTGVAVLQINGVISPKANLFTRVSGGAAASILQQQVNSMAADPKVRAAVIEIDSPGGNVLGIPALAEAIRALAEAKPTVSVSTGMMASASYWLGSAANAVYASGVTDMLGSIGVVATHSYDPRRAEVQTTEITAGKYKRLASDNAPLSAEGRDYMQAQVDELYRVFVQAVASNRRVSAEDVLANMADGRLFIGEQAVSAGLVDGIATVDQIVAQLDANPAQFAKRRRAVFAAAAEPAVVLSAEIQGDGSGVALPLIEGEPVLHATTSLPEGVEMTPAERAAAFAAEHADAAALLRAEGSTAERDRIQREHEEALAAERRRAEEAERTAQAERDRAAKEEADRKAEAEREAAAQAKRDADLKHRSAVKTAAKQAIMSCGADEETAKKIVLAIIAGEVPAVSLRF